MVQKIQPRGVIWVPTIRPGFDDSNLASEPECSPSNLVVLASAHQTSTNQPPDVEKLSPVFQCNLDLF